MGGQRDDSDDTNGDGAVDEFDDSAELNPEDLVTIRDDDGQELECAVIMVIEHEGGEYALLAPVAQLDPDEGSEIDLYVFRYIVDEEGMQVFASVDDDATYEAVREQFALMMDQE